MIRFIRVVAFFLIAVGLYSCSNTAGTDTENDRTVSTASEQKVLITLQGRIDFADGTYLESYDKERLFEIPVSNIETDHSNYVYAGEAENFEDLISGAACSSYYVFLYTGSFNLSGLTTVTFSTSTATVTDWCHPYDEFNFTPRVFYTTSGANSFTLNSSLKRDGGSTDLYSGTTSCGASSAGSYYEDGRNTDYSKTCGRYAEGTFDDLKVTIFNDDTNAFTITKVWLYLRGVGPYCDES